MPWFGSIRENGLINRVVSCKCTCELLELYGEDLAQTKFLICTALYSPEGILAFQWERILRGETLNLDHFLSSIVCTQVDEDRKAHLGETHLTFSTSEAKRKVRNSADWASAWRRASEAIVFAFPHRHKELEQYQKHIQVVFDAQQPHAHQRVIAYDIAVRNFINGGQTSLLTDQEKFSHLYAAIVLSSHPPTPPTLRIKQCPFELQRASKLVTSSTPTRAATTTCVNTNTSVRNVEEITPRTNTTHRSSDEGLQPKYWQYNLWRADNQKPMTTTKWSEMAIPLPRPPNLELENTVANDTITSHAHLFNVKTPINVDVFQSLLFHHPNRPFVDSVLAGLQEGFWPWANMLSPHFPSSYTQEPNSCYDEVHLSFFCDQLQHEQERGRYSPSLGATLIPSMYSMPIYAVPKPGSTNLRLVNDHSAGPYALNSMIDHSLVTGYSLDNLHQLENMLLDLHVLTPGLDLIM